MCVCPSLSHANSFKAINRFLLNLVRPACQVRWCPLAFSNSLLTVISTWWPVTYVILTFALTFSNDAGFTSEKQMRNTSCKKTNQNKLDINNWESAEKLVWLSQYKQFLLNNSPTLTNCSDKTFHKHCPNTRQWW